MEILPQIRSIFLKIFGHVIPVLSSLVQILSRNYINIERMEGGVNPLYVFLTSGMFCF